MDEKKFPYKPKIYILLPGTLILIGCAIGFGNTAITNEKELIISFFKQALLTLSPEMATIAYWLITILFFSYAIYIIKAIYLGLTTTKEIIISKNKIVSPESCMNKNVISIKFNEINNINIRSIKQQRFLDILYHGGKLTIPQSMLPNKYVFEELVSLVSARMNGEPVNKPDRK